MKTNEDSAGAGRAPADAERIIAGTVYVAVGLVAAFAFGVSYSHIYDLGLANAQHGIAAKGLPLSVDLLIVAATLIMWLMARTGVRPSGLAWWLPRAMLYSGIGATVAANVAYGLPSGWLAAVISAWPGYVFAGLAETVLVTARWLREHASQGERARAALYRLFSEQRELLYVGISLNPHVRLTEHARAKPWWSEVADREIDWYETWELAAVAEHAAIKAEQPKYNISKQLDMGQRIAADQVPQSALAAARAAYVASFNGGNPLSERALCDRFGISRRRAQQIRAEVAQEAAQKTEAPVPELAAASMNGDGSHGA